MAARPLVTNLPCKDSTAAQLRSKPHTTVPRRPAYGIDTEGLSRRARDACLGAAVAVLVAAAPLEAQAYNVRLEDVESASMQAGVLAATQGRFQEAERFFNIYLQEDPASASAWSNLGNVHLSQASGDRDAGRTSLAVSDYTKAIELAPEAPVPYLNRALAVEQLGVDRAEEGSERAARQLWEGALADCDAAIQRDSREFAAWFDRGDIAMRLERYDQALTDFRTAANLAPGLAGYRLREATLLYQQGEPEEAKTMMRGIARKYPGYAEAHAALAAVQWAEGQQTVAEAEFEKATRQDSRWGSLEFIRSNTRWPPKLYTAMARFLSIV
ncbi:hypothetical protein N2152v2_008965 [Parachlorella kessleri]